MENSGVFEGGKFAFICVQKNICLIMYENSVYLSAEVSGFSDCGNFECGLVWKF